jgi:hypothetical protein
MGADDFVALVEAARTEPETCTTLKLVLPVRDGYRLASAEQSGPLTHYAQHPAQRRALI